jgi:hypothetical protein
VLRDEPDREHAQQPALSGRQEHDIGIGHVAVRADLVQALEGFGYRHLRVAGRP